MEKAGIEKKLHEKLDVVLNRLEEIAPELNGMLAEDGEQVYVNISVLPGDLCLAMVTVSKGSEWHSVVNGRRIRGEWTESEPIGGDFSKRDDAK